MLRWECQQSTIPVMLIQNGREREIQQFLLIFARKKGEREVQQFLLIFARKEGEREVQQFLLIFARKKKERGSSMNFDRAALFYASLNLAFQFLFDLIFGFSSMLRERLLWVVYVTLFGLAVTNAFCFFSRRSSTVLITHPED